MAGRSRRGKLVTTCTRRCAADPTETDVYPDGHAVRSVREPSDTADTFCYHGPAISATRRSVRSAGAGSGVRAAFPTTRARAALSSSRSISNSPNLLAAGLALNSPIRSARSKSGSLRTCRSSRGLPAGRRRSLAEERFHLGELHGLRLLASSPRTRARPADATVYGRCWARRHVAGHTNRFKPASHPADMYESEKDPCLAVPGGIRCET